jgi:hypothetical protein
LGILSVPWLASWSALSLAAVSVGNTYFSKSPLVVLLGLVLLLVLALA